MEFYYCCTLTFKEKPKPKPVKSKKKQEPVKQPPVKEPPPTMAAMTTDPEIQEVSQLTDDFFDSLTMLIV